MPLNFVWQMKEQAAKAKAQAEPPTVIEIEGKLTADEYAKLKAKVSKEVQHQMMLMPVPPIGPSQVLKDAKKHWSPEETISTAFKLLESLHIYPKNMELMAHQDSYEYHTLGGMMPQSIAGQVHYELEINFTLQTPQAFHQFSQWHEKNGGPAGIKVGGY